MDVTVGGVPHVVTEDGQHWLVANNSQYSIGLFVTWKTDPEVITQPQGMQGVTIPPDWTGRCGFCRYNTQDKLWWDRVDAPQIPETPGSVWAKSVDIRCILADGSAHTIATLTSPFQTQSLEGYFLPETGIFNPIKYIYMKSSDLNPIPSGLTLGLKGFSFTEGKVDQGFMVDIGSVSGSDRIYSAPVPVHWWGFTPADIEMTYQAPVEPPALCGTQEQAEASQALIEQQIEIMLAENPAPPEIPEIPEVGIPPENGGGAPIPEPTPDPNCVCSASYHYIAKAIDTRGEEIAGEIRGYRREFVQLTQAINEFLQTMTKQNDRTKLTVSDEIRDTLKKIVKALYLNADNPAYDPSRMTLSDLLASLLNHMEIR